MSRREQVYSAIEMKAPDYLPLVYFNGNRERSDVIICDLTDHYGGPSHDRSEWGFRWERTDETMGQPTAPVLTSLEDRFSLSVPKPRLEKRLAQLAHLRGQYGSDRYYIGSLVLSGFTVVTALLGYSESMVALLTDAEAMGELSDTVFGFEEEIIDFVAGRGLDAIGFFDDWGMQEGMVISPEVWRGFFKDRYRRQFAAVHDAGMQVYFHSCGFYYDIIPDLIEIGVDLLNISQPNLYDISQLAADFRGSVCFVLPVSYQTTAVEGNRESIRGWVKDTIHSLRGWEGGLIGYLEEYESVGVTKASYSACEQAFRTFGDFTTGGRG